MVEEKALLVGPDMPDEQVGLDRIAIEKMLRCLHQPDARAVEQRKRSPQEVAMRDEISVEDRDEFRGDRDRRAALPTRG
jgi:hypothetical protein